MTMILKPAKELLDWAPPLPEASYCRLDRFIDNIDHSARKRLHDAMADDSQSRRLRPIPPGLYECRHEIAGEIDTHTKIAFREVVRVYVNAPVALRSIGDPADFLCYLKNKLTDYAGLVFRTVSDGVLFRDPIFTPNAFDQMYLVSLELETISKELLPVLESAITCLEFKQCAFDAQPATVRRDGVATRGWTVADKHEEPNKEAWLPGDQEKTRLAQVADFIARCNKLPNRTGRIFKKHIWMDVGHNQARQFQHWQAEDHEEVTEADKVNFGRVLATDPTAWVAHLQKKGILKPKQ